MPVTIKTNARGWYEASSTNFWTSCVLFDTGSALYAVGHDSGASPRVRVLKANNRTNPTSFTEQDASNAPLSNLATGAMAVWFDAVSGYLWGLAPGNVGGQSAELDEWYFNTATDAYVSAGSRVVTTFPDRGQTIRGAGQVGTMQFMWATSVSDDVDLMHASRTTGNWSINSTGLLSATSTDFSVILDAGQDSTGRFWVVYQDGNLDDVFYITYSSTGTKGTAVALNTATAANGLIQAGSRFSMADLSGTDTIMAAYIDSGGLIKARTIALEADSASGQLGTETTVESTAANVGTRTPISTAYVNSTWYCAWWDDANSGTIYYATLSGSTWTRSTFATGAGRVVEIVPAGGGLAIIIQSGADLVLDWIVMPPQTIAKTVSQTAHVSTTDRTRSVPQSVHIRTVNHTRNVTQTVAARTTNPRTVPQSASIRSTTPRTTPQSAAVSVLDLPRAVPQSAAVRVDNLVRSIPETAHILTTLNRTVPESAAVRVVDQVRTIPQSAVIEYQLVTLTRTLPQSAALSVVDQPRTIPQSASLLTTHPRSIPQSATIRTTSSRSVSQSSAIRTTSNRTILQTAVASVANLTKAIPQSTHISVVNLTRSLPQTVAILTSHGRTVLQSAAIRTALSRSVPQSATVQTTGAQTVSQSSAIQVASTCSIAQTATIKITQRVGPVADVDPGGWTTDAGSGPGLYDTLDEPNPEDADFIQSGPNPFAPDTVILELGAMGPPISRTDHTLHYRYGLDNEAGPAIALTAQLYDGSTLIATDTPVVPTTTWVTRSWMLTESEAEAIEHYEQLRVAFTAEVT